MEEIKKFEEEIQKLGEEARKLDEQKARIVSMVVEKQGVIKYLREKESKEKKKLDLVKDD